MSKPISCLWKTNIKLNWKSEFHMERFFSYAWRTYNFIERICMLGMLYTYLFYVFSLTIQKYIALSKFESCVSNSIVIDIKMRFKCICIYCALWSIFSQHVRNIFLKILFHLFQILSILFLHQMQNVAYEKILNRS